MDEVGNQRCRTPVKRLIWSVKKFFGLPIERARRQIAGKRPRTQTSLRSSEVWAVILMTTALSWGINAHAAGLGVGVGANASTQVGANAGGADVRPGNQMGISSDIRARAMAGVGSRSDTPNGASRYQNDGRSADALSAVTDAKAAGQRCDRLSGQKCRLGRRSCQITDQGHYQLKFE